MLPLTLLPPPPLSPDTTRERLLASFRPSVARDAVDPTRTQHGGHRATQQTVTTRITSRGLPVAAFDLDTADTVDDARTPARPPRDGSTRELTPRLQTLVELGRSAL